MTLQTSKGVSLVKRSDASKSPRGVTTSRLTNAYLQDGAKISMMLRLAQYVMMGILCIFVAVLFQFSNSSYRLFATSEEGKLIAPLSLDKDLGANKVAIWTVDAITHSFTMGFHDYQMRLEEVRPYFTDRGWESYLKLLRTSYNGLPSMRSLLENSYLIMYPRPDKPPLPLRKGIVSGVFSYDLRFQTQIVRDSVDVKVNNTEILELTVERVPNEVNTEGLAISQIRLITNAVR